ncbi:putative restriction endonuclease [Insectomime virus]|nr:putative restriction endonuclease [Insectomime virus]
MNSKVPCAERKTGVCGKTGCEYCLPRSFLAKEVSEKWSRRNFVDASQVSASARGNFWFDCDRCRHQYSCKLYNAARGYGCPYCSNSKRCGSENCSLCFGHSFASHPMSEFWSKNNEDEPINVSLGSGGIYLFFCPDCGGEYKKRLYRFKAGEGCSLCTNTGVRTNRKVSHHKSFASSPRSSEWSPKNSILPMQVPIKSGQKFLFICSLCEYEYYSSPERVHKSKSCPFCSGRTYKKSPVDGREEKKISFVSARWSLHWSSKNELSPEKVSLCSAKKFLFVCPVCSHEFSGTASNYSKDTKKCPYCVNKRRCGKEECKMCFENSFASVNTVLIWSPKNKETPLQTAKCSNKVFLFECPDCEHEFSQKPNKLRDRKGCPYCGKSVICQNNECGFCWKESFAESPKAKFWSQNNKRSPRQIRKGCETKYEFICEKGHVFKTSPRYIRSGTWCPLCKKKTEAKLLKYLQTIHDNVIYQFAPDWSRNPKTGKLLPFDFCVNKTIIELDGPQHFRQVSNWTPPEETKERDQLKERLAKENGYVILRILQEDVWEDANEWKENIVSLYFYERCKSF